MCDVKVAVYRGPLQLKMVTIRNYRAQDAAPVGRLIAETYSRFNLDFVSPDKMKLFLGPFYYADSSDRAHREAIANVIRSQMVYVAEAEGDIVGVIRGRIDRVASLFVAGGFQRKGIGRRLLERFEQECIRSGARVMKVSATLEAVRFYQAMGYKKSTGVRTGWSFQGHGLLVQPMRKVL